MTTNLAKNIDVHAPHSLNDVKAEAIVVSQHLEQGLPWNRVKGLFQINIANGKRRLSSKSAVHKII